MVDASGPAGSQLTVRNLAGDVRETIDLTEAGTEVVIEWTAVSDESVMQFHVEGETPCTVRRAYVYPVAP